MANFAIEWIKSNNPKVAFVMDNPTLAARIAFEAIGELTIEEATEQILTDETRKQLFNPMLKEQRGVAELLLGKEMVDSLDAELKKEDISKTMTAVETSALPTIVATLKMQAGSPDNTNGIISKDDIKKVAAQLPDKIVRQLKREGQSLGDVRESISGLLTTAAFMQENNPEFKKASLSARGIDVEKVIQARIAAQVRGSLWKPMLEAGAVELLFGKEKSYKLQELANKGYGEEFAPIELELLAATSATIIRNYTKDPNSNGIVDKGEIGNIVAAASDDMLSQIDGGSEAEKREALKELMEGVATLQENSAPFAEISKTARGIDVNERKAELSVSGIRQGLLSIVEKGHAEALFGKEVADDLARIYKNPDSLPSNRLFVTERVAAAELAATMKAASDLSTTDVNGDLREVDTTKMVKGVFSGIKGSLVEGIINQDEMVRLAFAIKTLQKNDTTGSFAKISEDADSDAMEVTARMAQFNDASGVTLQKALSTFSSLGFIEGMKMMVSWLIGSLSGVMGDKIHNPIIPHTDPAEAEQQAEQAALGRQQTTALGLGQ